MNAHTKTIHSIHGASIMRKSVVFSALSFLVALGLVACAGDVPLIDRTQPNRLDKSIFQGEWYFRATVVDVQVNQGMLFEGYEGEMDRIRWDIREDQVVAYRSYPWLINAEQTNGNDEDFLGSPIAAFKVDSHFDINRDYNPATGEQSNTLVENTTDRPWYERRFMRVDWSQNLLNSQNLLGYQYALDELINAISGAPYYVQEHEVDNPFRPEVTADAINIVVNYILEPDFRIIEDPENPGWGWYDGVCYYTYLDPYFCGSSEAKIKLSFRKVKLSNYETLYYPDNEVLRDPETGEALLAECYEDGTCDKATVPVFERFGYFRHERRAYDKEFQWIRDGRVFIGHRWNMWQNNLFVDGTPIPMVDRTPREIKYYTSTDFPADEALWRGSQKLVDDWDNSFRETVASIQREVNPDITADAIAPIFVLEQNACTIANVNAYLDGHTALWDTLNAYGISQIQRGNLQRACSLLEYATQDPITQKSDFTWQKTGDLRYSMIHWVDKPQAAGPLGYGPSSADPITGEIINATANIYGASVDELASYAADIVGVMNGEISLEDLTQGTNVREYIAEARQRINQGLSLAKMQSFQNKQRDASGAGYAPDRLPMRYDREKHDFRLDREAVKMQREQGLASANRAQSRLNKFKGSHLERELLMNDDLARALMGPDQYQPGAQIPAGVSPLKWLNDDLKTKHEEAKAKLMKQCILLAEWVDPGMVSLSTQLQGKTWQEVYDWMRENIYVSVTAHEVGHTLGLRHNFRGSMDALNYKPDFWKHYHFDAGSGTGYIDDLPAADGTGAEQYKYSSIMDYDARFYADSLHGIGLYDNAAIKFGYGGLVEIFDFPTTVYYQTFLDLFDYTDIPVILGETNCMNSGCSNQDAIDSIYTGGYCGVASDAEAAALAAEDEGNLALATQKWNEYDINTELCNRYLNSYLISGLDGGTPVVENIHVRTDVTYQSIVENWAKYYLYWNYGRTEHADYNIPDEVPYKYCPDEYAYWTWVECKTWDKGANYLEVTRDRMQRFDSYYFFTHFKRDRAEFNDSSFLNSYLSSLYDRYFSQMSNVFIYSLYAGGWLGKDKNGVDIYYSSFPFGRDWQAAGLEGLNFLNSVLQSPEPGNYCLNTVTNTYEETEDPSTCAVANRLEVPLGFGRYFLTKWTDEYYYKATRIGSFWDKIAALQAMTSNEGFFFRDYSSFFDAGAFSLSYWSGGLQDETMDIFQGPFTGKPSKYAWRYNAAGADDSSKFLAAPVVDIYADIDQAAVLAMPKIQDASSWTLRYYGMIWPTIQYSAMFDYTTDFTNYSRVCLENYMDCMTFQGPAGVLVEFTDPLTNYKYVAPTTDRPDVALGAKLLTEANDYVASDYTPAKSAFTTCAGGQPPSYVPTGGTTDPCGPEYLALNEAERGINRLTAFLDIIRQIGYYTDY